MGVSNSVIGIIIALFIAGIIGPPALIAMNGTSLTANGVNANVITVWTILLPVLAVIAIALILLKRAS